MDHQPPPHHQIQVSAVKQVTQLQEKIAVAEMKLNDDYLPVKQKVHEHRLIVRYLTTILNNPTIAKEYYSQRGYNPTYISYLEMLDLIQMDIKQHQLYINTYLK